MCCKRPRVQIGSHAGLRSSLAESGSEVTPLVRRMSAPSGVLHVTQVWALPPRRRARLSGYASRPGRADGGQHIFMFGRIFPCRAVLTHCLYILVRGIICGFNSRQLHRVAGKIERIWAKLAPREHAGFTRRQRPPKGSPRPGHARVLWAPGTLKLHCKVLAG